MQAPPPDTMPAARPIHGVDAILALADCIVDVGQQTLTRGERTTSLTTLENAVLWHLWQHPGRTVTRAELLEVVWGHPRHASTEPVYSTIKRLRAKIEGPGPHRHIVTVHGDGYRFEPPPTRASAAPMVRPASLPPAARTRFVGREAELLAIEQRLAEGARLVTLVGPGGVGKTRSARELERRRAARGEPTVFVDLAEARSLEDALRALATALDVPLDGEDPVRWASGLGRALAARARAGLSVPGQPGPSSGALVVLDNVEQLVPLLAPLVARWSDAMPIVATSRERLHVSGEHAVELQPLSREDAVALFVDRALMASASFDVSGELEHIRSIVDRLDCLPLAIELAAARVRLLKPAALLGRLDDQLDQLGHAPRDQPMRHATLRAAVDWSWQLLGANERLVLAQCAVFVAGFTLDAAEAVVHAEAVADTIERLCDRSLIRARPSLELPSEARFELYAAVQQLAAEQLARLPEAEQSARRHALWVLDEAARWVADLDGRGHARARAHLELELDNLRHAFEHEVTRGDVGLAARLAALLDQCLRLRGGAAARRGMLERALARGPADLEEARLSLALGECLVELGDTRAPACLERAVAAAERVGNPDALTDVLAPAQAARAEVAASRGDLTSALADFAHAITRARSVGARRIEGRVATLMGEVLWRAGRMPEARAALEDAQRIHQEIGDLRQLARTNATLCHVLRAAGRPAQALALLDDAERGFEALGDPLGRARTLVDRGLHLSRVGRQLDAIAALERARAAFDRLGVLRGHEEVQLNLAEALLGLGEDERALVEVHRAVAVCRELGERLRLSTALELLACAALLRSDLAAAEGALDEALTMARASGNQRSESTVLSKRGLCHYMRSRWAESLADFTASTTINVARGEQAMEGTSRADVAVSLAALGHEAAARHEQARARELLGEPPSSAPSMTSTWVTRMLSLLEATATVHLARRHGESPSDIRLRALALRDDVLARMPKDAQDLATRLSSMMLDHALASMS